RKFSPAPTCHPPSRLLESPIAGPRLSTWRTEDGQRSAHKSRRIPEEKTVFECPRGPTSFGRGFQNSQGQIAPRQAHETAHTIPRLAVFLFPLDAACPAPPGSAWFESLGALYR